MKIPDRIRWALDTIRVRPTDRVFEIGCGPGVAAQLVCDRLTTGQMVAMDRSATALARARVRNSVHVRAETLTLVRAELASFDAAALFDTVFAINVNVFWTKPRGVERAHVEGLLAPGGRAWLFREEPNGRRSLLTCTRRGRARPIWAQRGILEGRWPSAASRITGRGS